MYALVTAANNSDREKSACQWTVDGFRKKTQYNLLYLTKIIIKKFREIKIEKFRHISAYI